VLTGILTLEIWNMNKKEFTYILGQNIRQIRTKLGISQTELASRCGKDQQHIELIENGKTTCTSYTLFLICKALECSSDDLIPLTPDH